MRKRLLCVLLSLVLLCTLPLPVLAVDDITIEPGDAEIGIMLTYISAYGYDLNINSSGLASCSANMTAYPGTDSVSISMYLQKYDGGWSTVKHWSKSAETNYAFLSGSYYVMSGYTYRVLVYFYAYEGSATESLNHTDSQYY